MFYGGDEVGIGIIGAFICVLALVFVVGFVKAVISSPWLIGLVIVAVTVYMLMRREQLRERTITRCRCGEDKR